MTQLSLHSPVGDITISEADGRIVALDWGWGRDQSATPLLEAAREQLNAYFDGRLDKFDLPVDPSGSRFQRDVWQQMCEIPSGATKTYGDIANALNNTARAVGQACGANPIPIIIPCHRVLAASGLGGYSGSGGIETKVAFLQLEGALL